MDGSKTLWQAFSVVLLLWTSAPPLSAALFSDLEGVSGTENNFPWEIKEEKGVPELRCYLPGPPINGSVSIWGGGLLIEYMCDEGFISVGDMIGACDYSLGIWTIDSPLCVGSDCPVPTRFPHGTIRMQHENGLATFDCHPGYHLYGSRVLRCMGKKWNSSQPTCLRNVDGNHSSIIDLRPIDPVRVRLERKKENITNLMESDESCHRQGISPPKIQHATGRTSYYYNTFRKIYVMLATYTCGDDYKLEHEDMKHLYCKNFRWVAPIKPKCVKRFTACEKRNGGCQHICVPESGRYSCACNSGYTLAPNRKSCIDMDECIFDNGLCQQECYNTIGSYFCACAEGFDQTGKSCTGM